MDEFKDIMLRFNTIKEKEQLPKPAIPILSMAMHNPNALTALPQKDLMLALDDIRKATCNVSIQIENVSTRIEEIVGVSNTDEEDFF